MIFFVLAGTFPRLEADVIDVSTARLGLIAMTVPCVEERLAVFKSLMHHVLFTSVIEEHDFRSLWETAVSLGTVDDDQIEYAKIRDRLLAHVETGVTEEKFASEFDALVLSVTYKLLTFWVGALKRSAEAAKVLDAAALDCRMLPVVADVAFGESVPPQIMRTYGAILFKLRLSLPLERRIPEEIESVLVALGIRCVNAAAVVA